MNSQTNIPGYSGHIPYKNHLVGLTTGAGNRAAADIYNSTGSSWNPTSPLCRSGTDIMQTEKFKSPYASPRGGKSNLEKGESGIMVGNLSRYSQTWINGPLHNVRP